MGNSETDDLTPFAHLLQEWMWRQRPPLNPTEMARRLGIASSTVHAWISEGNIPRVGSLRLISEHTDIPLRDLYAAAGYEWRSEHEEDRQEIDRFLRRYGSVLSDSARLELEELRERYASE